MTRKQNARAAVLAFTAAVLFGVLNALAPVFIFPMLACGIIGILLALRSRTAGEVCPACKTVAPRQATICAACRTELTAPA